MQTSRLILLLLSFAMFACSSAGVSMQGKGFDEFPEMESVSQSGVEYEVIWVLCSDEWMDCPIDISDGIVVRVKRTRLLEQAKSVYAESYAKVLVSAGFEEYITNYVKKIDKTIYVANSQNYRQVDYYDYIIEKPSAKMVKQLAVDGLEAQKIFITKAALARFLAEKPDRAELAMPAFIDMEMALADLEKAGLLPDSSIREDIKTMMLIGVLKVDGVGNMELRIFYED